MATTRERVLNQKVKRALDDRAIARINRKLDRLKTQSLWRVSYRWEKKKHLVVHTGPLRWDAVFHRQAVVVDVEGPAFLKPLLMPMRKVTVAMLTSEIDALSR